MDVSRQLASGKAEVQRGPRYRTRRLMLETATRLMQAGATPSVTDVAEAAGVSRATAYRYFPSQAALVHAVVDEALGPILAWSSASDSIETRVAELFDIAMPRIQDFEATFKAALRLSLEQWARRQAGTLGPEPQFTRGHRIDLLMDAIGPTGGSLTAAEQQRLAQALSLVFGVEALVVLGDIWGLDRERISEVTTWAAGALVAATLNHQTERR